MNKTPSFSLGMTVITPGALAALGRNSSTGLEYLTRHATGDWGDLCEDAMTKPSRQAPVS